MRLLVFILSALGVHSICGTLCALINCCNMVQYYEHTHTHK